LESHLAQLLAGAGIAAPDDRARELWLLFEGAMVLALIHGDRAYIGAASEAAKTLLSGPSKLAR
jgi:hypothetical protein